mmetsp:Transcript_15585/g.40302  ORF Transcript_15585/g.40302 Transcript_15585/m.40302 type:complete len:185 (+) Transcript_15585:453-1007(+)
MLKEEAEAVASSERVPMHIRQARARWEHDVTERTCSPRATVAYTPRCHQPRDLARHLSEASIPGYTGHLAGRDRGPIGASYWGAAYVPVASSTRGAAPPKAECSRDAARPPPWWHSATAPMTPRAQWKMQLHEHETEAARSWDELAIPTKLDRRTPHGRQRQAEARFVSTLRKDPGPGLIAVRV